MINRAYEVMVALDENDNKVEVPGLIVETEAEKAEWQGAEKRYALRGKEGLKAIKNGRERLFGGWKGKSWRKRLESFQIHMGF